MRADKNKQDRKIRKRRVYLKGFDLKTAQQPQDLRQLITCITDSYRGTQKQTLKSDRRTRVLVDWLLMVMKEQDDTRLQPLEEK